MKEQELAILKIRLYSRINQECIYRSMVLDIKHLARMAEAKSPNYTTNKKYKALEDFEQKKSRYELKKKFNALFDPFNRALISTMDLEYRVHQYSTDLVIRGIMDRMKTVAELATPCLRVRFENGALEEGIDDESNEHLYKLKIELRQYVEKHYPEFILHHKK